MTYDRRAASRILAELAAPGLFGEIAVAPRQIEYTVSPMQPEPEGHLTFSQRLYLERYMQPCRPDAVTSATHRIEWTDSDGIPNTGHFGPSDLGPIVPIAARETTLALWHSLRTPPISALDAADRAVLEATTTDHDPVDIFRVGIEATARALAQHALLANATPYRSPAEFAAGMRDSGIFGLVTTHWYWELQASTYRRGMVPVRFASSGSGTIRYAPDSLAVLRAMKEATITDAHTVMAKAVGEEGLTVEQAIDKYHNELDLISRQYALLPEGVQPRCLAAMPHDLESGRTSILPGVVERFVDTFTAVVQQCRIAEAPADDSRDRTEDRTFWVPDMNCRHCTVTIRGVLASMDIEVVDVDLVSKQVVAEFRSPRNRARALAAIRDSGYNPVGSR